MLFLLEIKFNKCNDHNLVVRNDGNKVGVGMKLSAQFSCNSGPKILLDHTTIWLYYGMDKHRMIWLYSSGYMVTGRHSILYMLIDWSVFLSFPCQKTAILCGLYTDLTQTACSSNMLEAKRNKNAHLYLERWIIVPSWLVTKRYSAGRAYHEPSCSR